MVDSKVISVINELIVQKFPDSLSLLLAGSLAFETAGTTSDVDLIVISKNHSIIDISIQYKNLHFDIIGGNIKHVRRLVLDDCNKHSGVYSYMIGNAEILFDTNNEGAELKGWAKRMWENGTNIDGQELGEYVRIIEGIMANIMNIKNDLDACKVADGERLYITANLIWAFSRYLSYKHGWWDGGKGKWQFKHLREKFPTEADSFVQGCYAYLSHNDPSQLLQFIPRHIR